MTKILEKHNLLSLLPMAALSSAASEPGTIDSFSLIGTQTTEGEDYMLIEMPETEAAPAEVSPALELDPNITTETLYAQLAEMEKTMSSLGLDAKQGLGSEAQGSDPPAGLVTSSGQSSTETLKTLDVAGSLPLQKPWTSILTIIIRNHTSMCFKSHDFPIRLRGTDASGGSWYLRLRLRG